MGIRHSTVVTRANNPNDERLQGDEWNDNHVLPQIAEPDDPDSGETLIWMSNGTGNGDVGDIMAKINFSGDIRVATIVDFSTLPSTGDSILTEDGDSILTEDGDSILGD